jgi:ElaA protein
VLPWAWSRFDDLGVRGLYDALQLRSRVFVVEQQAIYLDPDGADLVSWHLLGRDDTGVLQGYLRLVDPGVKYAEPSIGRVITAPEVRGSGLGRALMAEGLAGCAVRWPGKGIRISAQSRLRRFYTDFGFVAVGDDYLEDGIPHVEMLRQGTR